jgi:hypothetical protein
MAIEIISNNERGKWEEQRQRGNRIRSGRNRSHPGSYKRIMTPDRKKLETTLRARNKMMHNTVIEEGAVDVMAVRSWCT